MIRFIITIPPNPKYVNILFFNPIPGSIARETNNPPIIPPICATKSIELPIENRSEMKTIKARMQAIVERMGPNRYSSLQLISKKAIKPPKIPKIAVEAPTVTVLGLQRTLRVKPE